MLIHKSCSIVDLVVYDHIDILLARVLRDLGVCEFLGHFGGVEEC